MTESKTFPCGCHEARVNAGLCDVHNADGEMRAPRALVPICRPHVKTLAMLFDSNATDNNDRAEKARGESDSHAYAELKSIADTWAFARMRVLELLNSTPNGDLSPLAIGEAYWPGLNSRRTYLILRDVEKNDLSQDEKLELTSLENVVRARNNLFFALAQLRGRSASALHPSFSAALLCKGMPTRMNQLDPRARELLVDIQDELEIKRTRDGKLSADDLAKWERVSRALGTWPNETAGKILLGVSFERVLADGTRERVDPADLRITVAGDESGQAFELRAVDRG